MTPAPHTAQQLVARAELPHLVAEVQRHGAALRTARAQLLAAQQAAGLTLVMPRERTRVR